jgi:diaminopimelate epimerase
VIYLRFTFTKMHGAGNDYVFVNGFAQTIENPNEVSKKISHRHFGIGSDGLVLILPSEQYDFKMRMFNADGSEGQMCGNAVRCIGKYVFERGLTSKKEITLETLGGVKTLLLTVKGQTVNNITVNMGSPILEAKKIPMIANQETFINQPITVGGKDYRSTAVSMGNPHNVLFLSDIDSLDLEKTGPLFEHHPFFPERVNTEFVEIVDSNTLKMRVWERGSGETLACGTGASATVVAASLIGYVKQDTPVKVLVKGGELLICWNTQGDVIMSGSATDVFDGVIDL